MIRSLHILHCGSTLIDKGLLTYQVDAGKIVEMPYRSFLIKADGGNILFDAGINPEIVDYRRRTLGKVYNVTERDFLPRRLADIGVKPEEVNTVILSHLHHDHCGVLKAFPRAEIIVQRAEYRFALNAPAYAEGAYVRSNFDLPGLKWRLIDGDEFLMPGITAIFTPGHTPGHQSLMVELPQTGTLILTGDCVYIEENVEKGTIIGIFWNCDDTFYSMKKIKLLARIKNAQKLFSHDLDWLNPKKPSEYY